MTPGMGDGTGGGRGAVTLHEVRARIGYVFEPPAGTGRKLLRMMPAQIPGRQRVLAASIEATPAPAERLEWQDFFGNAVTELAYRAPMPETVIALRARVEVMAPAPGLDLSPARAALVAEAAAHRGLAPGAPAHFLGPSPRVPADAAIARFAREATADAATGLAALVALCDALHRTMRFDPTATTVDTPPAAAFAQRHGVCQDFAHIAIAGLRALHIPAGYVSGFLRTQPPPGAPRLEGADRMHAWVQAWCGAQTGWMEYDPTNAMPAGPDHVVVARGRDYGDVAPVQGVLRLSGGQTSWQAVDMHPAGPG